MTEHLEGHILIVDDQQNWREALCSLLRSRHIVQAVSSFEDAKQAIVEFAFDVAILDVRLVDKDTFNVEGLGLLPMIRERKPHACVVILTGYPESVRQGILREYGVHTLILKVPPGSTFDSVGFRALIQELVAKYR